MFVSRKKYNAVKAVLYYAECQDKVQKDKIKELEFKSRLYEEICATNDRPLDKIDESQNKRELLQDANNHLGIKAGLYDKLFKDYEQAMKEINLSKIANETMQEQLTIEKQRVKDLYIELQLLRNK